jgi:predicted nucleic acid-binding Zn ribbon protein
VRQARLLGVSSDYNVVVEPLNNAVPDVVRTLLSQGPMSEGKFEFAWRVAVGASLGRVTRPTLREDGTVEVCVDDAAWRKEVKRSQATILGRLQHLLGASVVKKLKITGGGR